MTHVFSLMLLFVMPLRAAFDIPEPEPEPTYESTEKASREEEQKKRQKNATEQMQKAMARVDFPAINAWLAVVQDQKARDGAIEFVIQSFDPAELEKKHDKKLKQFESEVMRFNKDFKVLPSVAATNAFVRWRPYMARLLAQPVAAAAVEVLKADKAEKEGKGAELHYPGQRRGVYPSVEKMPEHSQAERVPQPSQVTILLHSKADKNRKFPIPRAVLLDPKIAGRLAATLEADPEEREIELSYPPEILKQLVTDMQLIAFPDDRNKTLSEMIDKIGLGIVKSYVDALDKAADPISARILPQLIKAANQEDSPLLMQLYIRRYVHHLAKLKRDVGARNPQVVTEELRRQNFPYELLPMIATIYFLLFDEGIDRDVFPLVQRAKKVEKDEKGKAETATKGRPNILFPIPYDVLVAYGKFGYMNEYPDLGKNPNEEASVEFVAPLIFALRRVQPVAFRSLLRLKNIDVNAKSASGRASTPLAEIVGLNEVSDLRDLLDAGADITPEVDKSKEFKIAPFSRIGRASLPEWKLLVGAGVDVNWRSRNGSTPLQLAIQSRNVDVVKFLIASGADVNIKGPWGTAWKVLADTKMSDDERKVMQDILRKAGAKEAQ